MTVSFFVLSVAAYDLVTNNESYPMAPYNMYAETYAHVPYEIFEIKIFNSAGEMRLENRLLLPWDSARLETYVRKLIADGQGDRVGSLLNEIVQADRPFDRIQVLRKRWNSISVNNWRTPDSTEILAEAWQ